MRRPDWLPDDLPLLDDHCPLPLDRPFTRVEARAWGVSRAVLEILLRRRLVRPVVHGTYVAAQVRDAIECRVAALRLVVPRGAIVTDRTAAWLHGVDALPRSAAYEPAPLDVFSREQSRLRRPGVHSGIRTLADADVLEVDAVRVTSPLRTALDLGRLLPRYDAIGVLDGFLRLGVPRTAMLVGIDQFTGFRGVVQLRELVPFADPRAESSPESALRLHGNDAGLPALVPQYWVEDDDGHPVYRLDLAVPGLCYGAEYHGERFHTGRPNEEHDAGRTEWLDARGWQMEAFWKADLHGPGADPQARLRAGVLRARVRRGRWVPQGMFLP